MGSAVPIRSAQNKLAQWATRYWGMIDVIVASIAGALLLPAIFESMRTRDIQLGERISLVYAIWFVLAVIATVVILRARSEVVRDADSGTARLLDLAQSGSQPRSSSTPADASPESLRQRAMIVVHAMIDLILLFILQAIVRQPFVGLLGPQVSPGVIDGAFVVLVVLVAISILFRLHSASRPLIERLAIAGLDQVVPTAGFSSGSAAATFAARLSTATSRSAASVASRAESRPAEPPVSSPPSDVTRPTGGGEPVVAIESTDASVQASAPDHQGDAATGLAPPADRSGESTVLAPRVEPTPGQPRRPSAADETEADGASDQTVIAPPSASTQRKDGTS